MIGLILAIFVLTLSVGCVTRYVVAPLNPELIAPISDPPLQGRTWNDVYVQSLERAEALRRWSCRGAVLRQETLPPECAATEPAR